MADFHRPIKVQELNNLGLLLFVNFTSVFNQDLPQPWPHIFQTSYLFSVFMISPQLALTTSNSRAHLVCILILNTCLDINLDFYIPISSSQEANKETKTKD